MIYRAMCGEEVSALGFGTMRLPVGAGGPADIDDARAMAIFDTLYEGGVTYVDTAYSYHNGGSELFVGRALPRYDRSKLQVATKMPGHEVRPDFNVEAIFEHQLERTGAGYFDFYLMHNVYESSIAHYMDPEAGILEYLVEQKRRGRIRHLGFSCHGQLDTLTQFVEYCDAKAPGEVEFVQLQINYVDWTLQNARAKYNLVRSAGLDVVVMEPLRGGKLARLEALPKDTVGELERIMAASGAKTAAEVSFRWLLGLEGIKVNLSGMSTREQAEDNLRIFAGEAAGGPAPYAEGTEVREALDALGIKFADMQPCTGCRYCVRECPLSLDIPRLLKLRDDGRFNAAMYISMQADSLPEEGRPGNCLGCGACAAACPQGIRIPELIAELNEMLAKLPHWADISAARRVDVSPPKR